MYSFIYKDIQYYESTFFQNNSINLPHQIFCYFSCYFLIYNNIIALLLEQLT